MLWSSFPDKVRASSTARLLGERVGGGAAMLWSLLPDRVHLYISICVTVVIVPR